MDFRNVWITSLSRNSNRSPCYSLCFKPDGSQLIIACSNDLFFLNPETGKVVDQKRSHQAPVYCVRCSADGTFFASSSSDGTVVIWRSYNNEGFITYGSNSATRHLVWCPTKQLLISCSSKEYNTWRPEDSRASRTTTKDPIESVVFSPHGDVYILSFSNGVVNVYSTESQNVLQTFNYSSIVTSVLYESIDDQDFIVTADLDCRVSMFKSTDKSLVGKNSIPFEALCSASLGGSAMFFAFAGVSGRVSLLTSKLSYLGDFQTESKWIWDIAVDKQGRIAIATREGFVELRSIDFSLAFASAGDVVAYRTSINAMTVTNVANRKKAEVIFFKIILDIAMSSRYLLIQFKDAILLYRHERDVDDEGDDEEGKLKLDKVYEIPGSFENTIFTVTRTHIIGALDKILTLYDLSGHTLCQFSFDSTIKTVSEAPSFQDGAIVGCDDGRVYFVMIDQKEPVLITHHDKPIAYVQRQGLILGIIDCNNKFYLIDTFAQKTIETVDNITSFSFSDRVDGLYATSNGSVVTIHYGNCKPIEKFVEGSILGFVRNRILLTNHGSIEIVEATLPFEELVSKGEWKKVMNLTAVGPTQDQWKYVASESLKSQNMNVAKVSAPYADLGLSFYTNEIAPDIDEGKWSIEVGSFLGEVKHIKLSDGTGDEDRASQLEAAGVSEEALSIYASNGDWDNVFRLAKEKHLERCIVDYQFPSEVSEEAAKVLLDAGLGDGAIRILTKTKNVNSLARAHVFLGQWFEAISLSRLYSSVYNIIYPRFGQLLFESGQWFEALVCFFIPRDRDERYETFKTVFNVCAEMNACDRLSFVQFMMGLNDPEMYWKAHAQAICYSAVHRLRQYVMMPMSKEDAIDVFHLTYYIMACVKCFSFRGFSVPDILMQLLCSAAMLGQTRWVGYALKELSSFDIDDSSKHLAQRAVRSHKEIKEPVSIASTCVGCGKDFYSSSRIPLLVCGHCGIKCAFSTHSCKHLQLQYFEYQGEDGLELLEREPIESHKQKSPIDIVDAEYLESSPSELFVVQTLKKASGVAQQFWYNPNLISVNVCHECGTIMDEIDFENSVLEHEYCPICHTPISEDTKAIPEVQSDILDMLRTFEEESPVTF